MNKIYNPIVWVNNSPPALNEDNLNAMSQGLSDLDDRVIELAGDIVLSVTECADAAQDAQDAADTASAAAITATTKAGEAADSATAAAGSATTASTKAGEASTSATNAGNSATSASGSATSASTNALKSEGYAVGKQNGTDVTSESPYYENNAKHYAEEASSSASSAASSANDAASSARDAAAWSANPPYIGANGNWYVYDVQTSAYVDSGIDASITVTVGSTSTLSPGSSATVTNSGTSTDPILNFGIPQGIAGTSPEVTITSITDGHTVTITDAEHPTGQSFDVMNGTDGTDGISPEVEITNITGGHRVTFTDADHPTGQSFDVMDGNGAGDMIASVYDPNATVANAGGIVDYVRKSEGRYCVLDYGITTSAMSDTTTDNSAALTALIALVPNGSVIYFPAGIYNFASGITISKDITFIGDNVEVQSAGNTFDPNHNRPHDPMSILRYTGSTSGTIMFRRSGYKDINFINLTFDGGSFYISENQTAPTSDPKYEYLVESTVTADINGIDVSELAPGIIKNCQFWSFSGFAVRNSMHHYIENCGFFWCNKCIVTTFTDTLLHNLWFCKCHTAIFMSNLVTENPADQRTSVSVNVSDIWADQLTGHFIESDNGSSAGGFVTATSAQIVASNLWIDHVQMSAFYLPSATLNSSRISGTFGRVGMNYAGLADSSRTAAIAVESDFMYCGRFISNSIFELNISNTNGKDDTQPNPHNGECFSRLFTALETGSKYNKVTCNKFPVSKWYDTSHSWTKAWNYSSFYGIDGLIERAGNLDYVNGIHFHNNNPTSSTWAPYVGARYFNYIKRILYRCTAITTSGSTTTFTWAELQRGTQYESMPSTSTAQDIVGIIAQYTGTSNADYTHGYFYECINDGGTKKWVQIPVQDGISVTDLKTIVAASSDFADFQTRIAAL